MATNDGSKPKPKGKKRGPKRSPTQREGDLELVAKLDRRGWSQIEIANYIGISQQQVSFDLKLVRERYREATLDEMASRVEEKRRQYREVRREAWEAWERSKLESKKTSTESIQVPPKGEKQGKRGGKGETSTTPILRPTRVTETVEAKLPANEYLRTVLECLKAERELDGLDPERKGLGQGGGGESIEVFWNTLATGLSDASSMDEIEARITQVLNSVQGQGTPQMEPLQVPFEVVDQPANKSERNGTNGYHKPTK